MRFLRGPELGFDAQMQLEVARLEPHAAAPGEIFGLGHFGEAEQTRVEVAGLVFFAGRHGELHVIEREDGKSGLR